MHSNWLPVAVFTAALAAGVGEFVSRYRQLPAQVASHFDAQGNPNGWMSKESMATTMGTVAGLLAFTLAISWIVVAKAPIGALNVPRKDYWATPAREQVLRRMMIVRLLWFMAAAMILLAYLSHLMLDFNLRGGGRLTAWTPLGFYLAFVTGWCGEMFWTLNRAPREGDGKAIQ